MGTPKFEHCGHEMTGFAIARLDSGQK